MRRRRALWYGSRDPVAGLAAVLGWETDWGSGLHLPAPAPAPIAPRPVRPGLLPDYAIDGGLAARTETVSRTLFNPTRRPAPPAVVEAAKPRMQRGLYSLTGTTVAGDKGLAFLKEKSGGKSLTVRQGDTVSGMLVAEVKPDRVRLTLGDESEEVVLAVAKNSKPTPQPVAPAPPPAPMAAGTQPPVTVADVERTPDGGPRSLAERRQAARAAAAAAGGATGGTMPGVAVAPVATDASAIPGLTPGVSLPAPPTAAAAPPAAPTTTPGAAADPGWAQVYQRYQQRRQQQ